MKWFVFSNEISNQSMGYDILGYVETVAEDKTDATRQAQIKFGAKNVNYVERASHIERTNEKNYAVYE